MKKRALVSTGLSLMLVVGLVAAVSARPLMQQWAPGTANTTISLMNVDPAGQPATYVIDLLGQDGVSDAQIAGPTALPYRGEVRYDIGTYGLPFGPGWTGSAIVSSSQQLAAVANQRYEGPAYSSGDNWNGATYGSVAPSTELYMPYLTQFDANPWTAGQWTQLTVQNTGDTPATVYVNYYSQDGADRGQVSQLIGAGRSYTWEPDFTPDENRSAFITSTNPIAAVFDGFWSLGLTASATGWSTAYEGVAASQAGNELVYSNVYRARAGLVETGSWVQWSNVFVQNTSPSFTANITVTFYKTGEVTPSMQFTDTIPANSSHEFNTRYGGTTVPTAGDFATNLEADFLGSVTIESDQPIVGISHSFWDTYFRSGATYAASIPAQGAYAVYCPFINRLYIGGQWLGWSKIAVSNVDSVPAMVYVSFLNQDGSIIPFPELQGIPIAVGSADAFNTQYGTDSGNGTAAQYAAALGDSFTGGVLITSTARIVGISNLIWTDRINAINTFPEP